MRATWVQSALAVTAFKETPRPRSPDASAAATFALMKRLEASQHEYAEVAHDLRGLIGTYQAELKHSSNRLDDIARLLRVGFRLNERNRE